MLREILSFGRHKFKFDHEVEIVVMILVIYGIFGFVMTGFVLIIDSWIYGWFYGIYVLASSVPALLPTVFVVSVGVSEKRLAKKRIACVNSENILVAGKVKRALFDKTGTLTKQGLDFLSARSKDGWNSNKDVSPPKILETGMSCCHTLVQANNGTLVGNSLDRIMFEAAGAKMTASTSEQPETKNILVTKADGEVITVLKRFDFDHERMTQSVIAQTQDGEMLAFVKGSAERIKRLCHPDSIPNGFDSNVKASAKEGVYQIAMAMKKIEYGSWQMSRSEVEKDLAFIGVVSFKNILREESSA
jgi:cation-transporting ATPase 13A3/4/5